MTKNICKIANQASSEFSLPDLPYSKTDLEPYYTEKLLNLHHGKHHQTYVKNLNDLVKDTNYSSKSLEEIMLATAGDSTQVALFNNAAQIWNHTFFWHCMKKNGGGKPTGALLENINRDFGSFDAFKEEFSTKSVKLFGSGWCWLVEDAGKLKIVQTSNAANPLTDGMKPILTVDVWEHAYYPDYENRRPEFISKFLDNLINWDFVNQVYKGECSDL